MSARIYDEVHALSRFEIKPIPFWKTKPDLWFVKIEALFRIADITVDVIKYNYVIQCLDDTSLTVVSDFVLKPPAADIKYLILKYRLIEKFAKENSAERKLRELLDEVDLSDRRPSQVLRRMRDLAQNSVSEEVLRSLWLQRLLQQIQATLTATKYDLEELADRIMDVLPIGNNTVATLTPTQATSMDSQMSTLLDRVEKLETHLSRSESHVSSDRHCRSRSRSKSENHLCWYHIHFGINAINCTQPCGW
ncbi:hypothetical protein ALC62_02253 [Cyphomyrmex costatus]|uniref:DUF7041 domain-containing protein n=2 Tax=Cyphomyrmex costatus TaxID=456900 RepID=A0A151IN66_9HYME|nr:hypothetical protein ALC62_02253 [Cyphomyrmex costatus]